MKRILGLVAMLALGAGLFVAPHVAHAQRGNDTVNCYSDNGRRSYCRVPWRDARLIRQDSNTACIRGRTWDMDRGGLWVDNGCRGIFQEAGGWGGGGRPGYGGGGRPGYGGGGQVVSCGSGDKKRVVCRWPVGRACWSRTPRTTAAKATATASRVTESGPITAAARSSISAAEARSSA